MFKSEIAFLNQKKKKQFYNKYFNYMTSKFVIHAWFKIKHLFLFLEIRS